MQTSVNQSINLKKPSHPGQHAMRSIVAASAIIIGLVSTYAHSQTSTSTSKANAPIYCEGDQWRYQQTEHMKQGLVHVRLSKTARGGLSEFTHTLEGETATVGARTEVRNATGNRTQLGEMKYAPDSQAYQFPLQVGKTWEVDYSFTSDTSPTTASGGFKAEVIPNRRQGTATVTALEKVSTPAGSFEAYRIEQSGRLTQPSTGGGTFSAQYHEVNWYAPATKSFVKYDYQHEAQLPKRTRIVRSSILVHAQVKTCE